MLFFLEGKSPAFNSNLIQNRFSGDAEVFEVVFFGKREINENKSTNYRPVSLLSTLSKIYRIS